MQRYGQVEALPQSFPFGVASYASDFAQNHRDPIEYQSVIANLSYREPELPAMQRCVPVDQQIKSCAYLLKPNYSGGFR
jgi:hypothetical protein